jgi:hypothetical protein
MFAREIGLFNTFRTSLLRDLSTVMPGFMHRRAKARRSSNGYGIHVFTAVRIRKTWMAGT